MEQTNANNQGLDGIDDIDDFDDADYFEEDQFPEEATEQVNEIKTPHVIRSYVDPNKVGMKRDDRPDALWLINATVEHLTPAQIAAEETKEAQPVDIQPLPFVETGYIPEFSSGLFDNIYSSTLGSTLEDSTTDMMYVTSISSLVIITILVLSVVISYTSTSSSRQLNEKPSANNSGRTPGDGSNAMTSMLSRAFNFLNLSGKIKSNKGENGSDNEKRGLNLQFSEGDQSDEDNSQIVNILDRRQYHQRSTSRSDPEQMQPSFFEKISTGSNTDSDLRVVRFDDNGRICEPTTTNCTSSLNDFDEVPKFKMPVQSEKQQLIQENKAQIMFEQQQQIQQQYLFEDFKTTDCQKLGEAELAIAAAKLHKQNLMNQATSPAILMEDNIVDEKLTCESGSTLLGQTSQSLSISVGDDNKESTGDIYEQQRQYYFGTAATDQNEDDTNSPGLAVYKEDEVQLDETPDSLDMSEPMAFPSPRKQSINLAPLENIVELNYEASSDEERLLTRHL